MDKYEVPPHNKRSRFVSNMAQLPITVPYKAIPVTQNSRDRLVGVMKVLKAQYDDYLSNPHLPHFMAAMVQLVPPRQPVVSTNPYATIATNIGLVEKTVAVRYEGGHPNETPLFEIQSMWVGHRMITTTPWVSIKALHIAEPLTIDL